MYYRENPGRSVPAFCKSILSASEAPVTAESPQPLTLFPVFNIITCLPSWNMTFPRSGYTLAICSCRRQSFCVPTEFGRWNLTPLWGYQVAGPLGGDPVPRVSPMSDQRPDKGGPRERPCPFYPVRTRPQVCRLQQGRGLPGARLFNPDLSLLPPELWEIKSVLISHPVDGALL